MGGYTYDVVDVYNVFGGGHCYRVRLRRGGQTVRSWTYDSILGIGGLRARARMRSLESTYGARREN